MCVDGWVEGEAVRRARGAAGAGVAAAIARPPAWARLPPLRLQLAAAPRACPRPLAPATPPAVFIRLAGELLADAEGIIAGHLHEIEAAEQVSAQRSALALPCLAAGSHPAQAGAASPRLLLVPSVTADQMAGALSRLAPPPRLLLVLLRGGLDGGQRLLPGLPRSRPPPRLALPPAGRPGGARLPAALRVGRGRGAGAARAARHLRGFPAAGAGPGARRLPAAALLRRAARHAGRRRLPLLCAPLSAWRVGSVLCAVSV